MMAEGDLDECHRPLAGFRFASLASREVARAREKSSVAVRTKSKLAEEVRLGTGGL